MIGFLAITPPSVLNILYSTKELGRRDLLGRWMFLLLKRRDFELLGRLDSRVVKATSSMKIFRHGGLLEDHLPWALGLARTAIDALVRMDVGLVGHLFSVIAYVLVDAVNRTTTDASCIETVYAKAGYRPRHLLVFCCLNGPQPTNCVNSRLEEACSLELNRLGRE